MQRQINEVLCNMFYIQKPDIFGFIPIGFVLACIGRFCTPKCPHGYYREQCNETCMCDADTCADVFGCITTGKIYMQYVNRLHLFCKEKL